MPKKNREKTKKGQKAQLWKRYKDGKLLGKLCPKCRSFLADHKTRLYCGKCGYVETMGQPKAPTTATATINTKAVKK